MVCSRQINMITRGMDAPTSPPPHQEKKKKKQKKEEKDWVSHSAYRNNNILFLTLAGSISAYRIYDYKNR